MRVVNIETERARMRLIQLTDLSDIHALHSLPETDEYNALGIPKDIDETKSIITSWIDQHQSTDATNNTLAIIEKTTDNFIGLFGLKRSIAKYKSAEVWYKLHVDYWNQGYATEVLKVIIDYCFETLHLHRVEAGVAVDNIASIRVLEKVGMTKEGRHRQILPLKSGWSDNFKYAILESDPR